MMYDFRPQNGKPINEIIFQQYQCKLEVSAARCTSRALCGYHGRSRNRAHDQREEESPR